MIFIILLNMKLTKSTDDKKYDTFETFYIQLKFAASRAQRKWKVIEHFCKIKSSMRKLKYTGKKVKHPRPLNRTTITIYFAPWNITDKSLTMKMSRSNASRCTFATLCNHVYFNYQHQRYFFFLQTNAYWNKQYFFRNTRIISL